MLWEAGVDVYQNNLVSLLTKTYFGGFIGVKEGGSGCLLYNCIIEHKIILGVCVTPKDIFGALF